MKINQKTIDTLQLVIKVLPKLPENLYFNLGYDAALQIEARTQKEVRQIRGKFRGIVWEKKFEEWQQMWTYTATLRTGLKVRISGVTEGPKQCKMIEETVMEERSIPVGYKKEMVEVKRVKYICPETSK